MAELRRKPNRVLLAVALAWVGLLLILPVGALTTTVVRDLPAVFEGLTDPNALRAIVLTVAAGAVAVVLHSVFGVITALAIVRQRFWGRRVVDALVDIPLALSPVMTGLAFLLLFGRDGWLRPGMDLVSAKIAFAWPGVVIATLFVTLPFVTREVALVLEELGDDEERAAATLGASPWQTFFRVTLPNIRHGLEIGVVSTSARALGEFGAVLVVGGAISGRTQTATTFIHAAMEERAQPAAYGMALLLGALAAALMAWLTRRRAH